MMKKNFPRSNKKSRKNSKNHRQKASKIANFSKSRKSSSISNEIIFSKSPFFEIPADEMKKIAAARAKQAHEELPQLKETVVDRLRNLDPLSTLRLIPDRPVGPDVVT